ncbi:MAG: CCA tRNA nucleotidyltransferase [Lachnospiraceae bacterium]|nr:CCA tRNA nucleotidyltransferase [Lachnospiraceae bacterium]
MIIQLPGKVKYIIDTLIHAGYEAYAVGGCIRDSILGRVPGDWDITTSASPWQVKQLFSKTVDTGIQHGTVTVMEGKEGFEVTTYRIDGEYEDQRHPREVIFTSSLLEDLKRRDFTINAMAYNEAEGLIDAFHGMEDIEKGVIRCVGNPVHRFDEDALRMMRAVRFAAQLGFTIEETTRTAILKRARSLAKISSERIQVELVKLLVSEHPEEMRTVYELGMSHVFLPEFDEMMQTPQNNRYHRHNVGEHSILAMQNIRNDKILRLTMLLHDVGKPVCRTVDENGIYHFYGHPAEGAKMAKTILRRLKFDNDTVRRVTNLIAWHDDRPSLREASVRRAIHRVGLEQYPALFEVKRADALAKNNYRRKEKLELIDLYESLYQEIMEKNQCLTLKDLAVNGTDMLELGLERGKEIGMALNRLLMHVLECPEDNNREILMNLVKTEQKSE